MPPFRKAHGRHGTREMAIALTARKKASQRSVNVPSWLVAAPSIAAIASSSAVSLGVDVLPFVVAAVAPVASAPSPMPMFIVVLVLQLANPAVAAVVVSLVPDPPMSMPSIVMRASSFLRLFIQKFMFCTDLILNARKS